MREQLSQRTLRRRRQQRRESLEAAGFLVVHDVPVHGYVLRMLLEAGRLSPGQIGDQGAVSQAVGDLIFDAVDMIEAFDPPVNQLNEIDRKQIEQALANADKSMC